MLKRNCVTNVLQEENKKGLRFRNPLIFFAPPLVPQACGMNMGPFLPVFSQT
jgi:hypothetical protein